MICMCDKDTLETNPNCALHGVTPAVLRRRHTARLDEFDKQAATITQIRGADYGPPRQDFERAQAIFKAIMGDGADVDPAVCHVFYMMAVKLARLRVTPTHLDSWIDIAGYARCGVTVTDDLLPGGSRYAAAAKSAETAPNADAIDGAITALKLIVGEQRDDVMPWARGVARAALKPFARS